jgi:hypothetical protein
MSGVCGAQPQSVRARRTERCHEQCVVQPASQHDPARYSAIAFPKSGPSIIMMLSLMHGLARARAQAVGLASGRCALLASAAPQLRAPSACASTASGITGATIGAPALPSVGASFATANGRAAHATGVAAGSIASSTTVTSPLAHGQAPSAREASAARIERMFYRPVSLTAREEQVFSRVDDEPALPLVADHGLLYGTTAAALAGRSVLVTRALSTRTGNVEAMRVFQRAELLRKFAPAGRPFDTGSSRVQGA